MEKFKAGLYVISIENIGDIKKNSVGLVNAVNGSLATVFFVGCNKINEVSIQLLNIIDIRKTGKPYDKKICNICHILKKINEFDINQTDAQGRKTTRPSCKVCRVEKVFHR